MVGAGFSSSFSSSRDDALRAKARIVQNTNGHDQRSDRVSDRLSMGFNTSSRPHVSDQCGFSDTVAVLPELLMGFHLFAASWLELQEDRVRQRPNLLT